MPYSESPASQMRTNGNRISNTILIELTGLDNNGQIKTQKGVKAGC